MAAAPSRRSILRGIGASCAGLTAAGWGGLARASDISLGDRMDLLYSNQFHFDGHGEPRITVGLMEGRRVVNLSAPGGLRVLPSGDGGTAVVGGSRWQIRLGKATPARQRFSVVLETVTSDDSQRLQHATARWKARGHTPREIEVGALFGVGGRVLDTRKVLLVTGDFSSESEARRAARTIKQRFGGLGRLHPEVKRRSAGQLVATDLDHDIEIRAEGVLWFAPTREGQPIRVADVVHGTTMNRPEQEHRTYRGQIYAAIDRTGKLAVVNSVSETDLLAGLVPAEIYASGPMEALQAQAIAARGQLVAKIGSRHLDDPFLLCSQQHCQVYAGMDREHPRTTAAVRATAGRVLMRPNGSQLVDTVYSANSGGHTEDNDLVWPSPPDPQLRGRPDPMIADRFPDGIGENALMAWLTSPPTTYSEPSSAGSQASYRWRTTLDPATIAQGPGVPTGIGPITGLQILARGCSGRATTLRMHGRNGTADIQGELRIRRALGGLRSSMFVVLPDRDRYGRFQLVGGGHGHGVGLCQHGAIGMARARRDHAGILAHYYPGSDLIELW